MKNATHCGRVHYPEFHHPFWNKGRETVGDIIYFFGPEGEIGYEFQGRIVKHKTPRIWSEEFFKYLKLKRIDR